jgi:subfamily B ATP-binding cassette protein MsbA
MWSLAPLRNGIVKDLRRMLHGKILILPLSFFSEKKKGDLISRATSDIQDIQWTILGAIELMFKHIITVIAFIIVLFWTNTALTIVLMLILPLSGFTIAFIGKALRKKSMKAQTYLGTLLSYFEESLGGLRIIKGFNAIKSTEEKFNNQNAKYNHVANSVLRRGDLASPMSEVLSITVVGFILWYGGNMVLNPENSLKGEDFIFYVLLFSQLIPSIKNLASGYYRIQRGNASADRVFEILDADEKIFEKKNAISVSEFKSKIAYENISFKYEDEWVLKNINLEIPKGKTYALVGASGAGKSTLADLLPRFYDTVEGKITIDGIDIRDMKIFDLRNLLGIVTQESILFNDTIKNNICFGKENVDDEDIINAAKAANAHEFIMHLPKQYDTFIGDKGSKLSGGQRQRLTIARAILKNPPIMILDEATSSLDTESEKLVQDALLKLMQNRTSIIIAHRLSTIQNADRIVVLNNGEIAESGTHSSLLQKDGIYKKLYEMQSFE